MSYDIILSEHARVDIRNIFEYIAYKLLTPQTGQKMIRNILAEINTLQEFPERFRIYPNEPMCSNNVRFFPIEKYLVFYKGLKDSNSVIISRIIYGGRDIKKQFSEPVED